MKRLVSKIGLGVTARRMCLSISGLLVGLLLLGLIVGIWYPFERPAPYAIGLLIGSLLSVAKVILMEKAIGHALNLGKRWAQVFAVFQAFLRYLLTAGVLACPFLYPSVIGVFGTVFGVLTFPAAAHIAGRLPDRKSL